MLFSTLFLVINTLFSCTLSLCFIYLFLFPLHFFYFCKSFHFSFCGCFLLIVVVNNDTVVLGYVQMNSSCYSNKKEKPKQVVINKRKNKTKYKAKQKTSRDGKDFKRFRQITKDEI